MLLRIATRQSPLALWQARHVQSRLMAGNPHLRVELVPLVTSGDKNQDKTIAAAGGKGMFVKELDEALLARRAELAVHSMKDVPAQRPDGLVLAAFLAGEDPRDAFVSRAYPSLDALPRGARVGTGSLRRQAQLRALRPDLAVSELRGNVGTRLTRLDEGRFDAILLAAAGLKRLGEGARIRELLDAERFVPAIGQGVVGVECREDDHEVQQVLAALSDPVSTVRLTAERTLNARLGGSCTVPVAGHAVLEGDRLRLTGLVAAPDGATIVRDRIEGPAARAATLANELADRLLARGGREILRGIGVSL